jgi:thiol-disulfide isomerase/thioredoxin
MNQEIPKRPNEQILTIPALWGFGCFVALFLLMYVSRHSQIGMAITRFLLFAPLIVSGVLGWRSLTSSTWLRGVAFGLSLCVPGLAVMLFISYPRSNSWAWLFFAFGLLLSAALAQSMYLIRKGSWLFAVAVLVSSFIVVFVSFREFPKILDRWQTHVQTALINKPLPELALLDMDGKRLPISQLRDHITVVDFWGIWCVSCVAEMPLLNTLAESYAGNSQIRFLLVDPEMNGDDPTKIARFLKRNKITMPAAVDPSLSFEKLGLNEFPMTLLIDQNVRIRAIHPGFDGFKEMEALRSEISVLQQKSIQ